MVLMMAPKKNTALSIRVSSEEVDVLDAFLQDYRNAAPGPMRGMKFSRTDLLWQGMFALMQAHDEEHGTDWFGKFADAQTV